MSVPVARPVAWSAVAHITCSYAAIRTNLPLTNDTKSISKWLPAT
jgi:hypothetical protein